MLAAAAGKSTLAKEVATEVNKRAGFSIAVVLPMGQCGAAHSITELHAHD